MRTSSYVLMNSGTWCAINWCAGLNPNQVVLSRSSGFKSRTNNNFCNTSQANARTSYNHKKTVATLWTREILKLFNRTKHQKAVDAVEASLVWVFLSAITISECPRQEILPQIFLSKSGQGLSIKQIVVVMSFCHFNSIVVTLNTRHFRVWKGWHFKVILRILPKLSRKILIITTYTSLWNWSQVASGSTAEA